VKEKGREQGLTDKDVARKFTKEQARARIGEMRRYSTEQCCVLDRVRARERRSYQTIL